MLLEPTPKSGPEPSAVRDQILIMSATVAKAYVLSPERRTTWAKLG